MAIPTAPSGRSPDEIETLKWLTLALASDAGAGGQVGGGAAAAPPRLPPQEHPVSAPGVVSGQGAPIPSLVPPSGGPINASISTLATAATFLALHRTPPKRQQGVCVVVDAHG